MFKSLLIVLSLASTGALACPDLTGDFACKVPGGDYYDFSIQMRQENGNFIYEINYEDFVADNNPHLLPDDGDLKNLFYILKCDGSALKSTVGGDVFEADQKTGEILLLESFSLDSNNNLFIERDYSFIDNGNTVHKNTEQRVCTRQ